MDQSPWVQSTEERRKFVPNELIVRFKAGVTAGARASVAREEGAVVGEQLLVPRAVVVRLAPGKSVTAAAEAFEQDPAVEYAEPNWIHEFEATPNDPRYFELWGLNQASDADIDAPQAWDSTAGSATAIVGVADSGVEYTHPDLSPNIWANNDPPNGFDDDGNGRVDDTVGWDFFGDDNAPLDDVGHGTHVAGTIGATGDNALGVTGVNWDVSLMVLRVGGAAGAESAAVADAFTYACAEGADVVNGSFGSLALSTLIRDAVLACPSILFVFSAGNDASDLDFFDHWPCELHEPPHSAQNVVCVAASDQSDRLASFSNHGTSAVHLAAPGIGILSTVPASQGSYGAKSGTSIATPHVAGVAGLLVAQNASRTSVQLKTLLTSSVDVLPQLSSSTITGGRLNACRAVARPAGECAYSAPAQPPPPPPPPPADTTPPTDPFISSPSHAVGVTSRNRTVEIRWSGASDNQSGVDGFSILVDTAATSVPDTVKDAEEDTISVSTVPLPDGRYYLHLRTRDNAGNWSSGRHFGPIVISVPRSPTVTARCLVPNVRGQMVKKARGRLARARCSLGRVTRAYSGRVRRGRIIKQSRRPGARLPVGTRVNVVVSRGRRR